MLEIVSLLNYFVVIMSRKVMLLKMLSNITDFLLYLRILLHRIYKSHKQLNEPNFNLSWNVGTLGPNPYC